MPEIILTASENVTTIVAQDTSLVFDDSITPTVMRANVVIAQESNSFWGFAGRVAAAILEGGVTNPTVFFVDGGLALCARLLVDHAAVGSKISWDETELWTWATARYPQFDGGDIQGVSGGAAIAANTYGPFDYVILHDPGLNLAAADFAGFAREWVYSSQEDDVAGTAV